MDPETRHDDDSPSRTSELLLDAERVATALQALGADAEQAEASGLIAEAVAVIKQLSAALEASVTRYRTLFDAVPDAVTVHDEHGAILDANRAAETVYGYPRERLVAMDVQDLNPSLPRGHVERLWSTFAEGETVTDTRTNRRADGSVFPIEVHSNAYLDAGARRLIAVARDVGERHRAEQRLHASEARFMTLLRAMDKGVVIQDEHGMIVSANQAACHLLGMSEADLAELRKGDLAAWHVIDAGGTALTVRDLPGNVALRTGHAIESTLIGVLIPHLHAYRWFSVSSAPDVDRASGRTVNVVSTFSDVTALKRETEMFRTAQQLGDIGCWELDDLRGSMFWTDQMFRIHDLPVASPVTEARALGFFAPESRPRAAAALAATRGSGTGFELELEIITAIGRRRWVAIHGEPLRRHGRIYGVIGTLQNIEQRRAAELALRRQAEQDSLTGLANRNALLAQLESALATAGGRGTAVMYVDPDHFKLLNDRLGHAAGDSLLREVAHRLDLVAENVASVGRYGNDEFVIVVPEIATAAAAEAFAERVVRAFDSPFELDTERFVLSVSVGVAVGPVAGTSSHELLRNADTAMREAKRRGRGRWHTWSPDLDAQAGDAPHG